MENIPVDIPVDYKIKVLSVDAEQRPPRAVVEVQNIRYQVTYQAPNNAPPLRKDQYLSVVVPARLPASMVMVKRVNDKYELEDGLYGLYNWTQTQQPVHMKGKC